MPTVPAVALNESPLIEYSPPLTLIVAGALRPDIVAVFEVTVALRATPVCAVKLKVSGVLSSSSGGSSGSGAALGGGAGVGAGPGVGAGGGTGGTAGGLSGAGVIGPGAGKGVSAASGSTVRGWSIVILTTRTDPFSMRTLTSVTVVGLLCSVTTYKWVFPWDGSSISLGCTKRRPSANVNCPVLVNGSPLRCTVTIPSKTVGIATVPVTSSMDADSGIASLLIAT